MTPDDVSYSTWAVHRRNGGRRLVVGFSAANTPQGKFRFYAAAMSPSNDALLFNVPENDWYMNGVPLGNGESSLGKTVEFIRRIAADYDELVFLGGSMGGYAALLYGSHFPGAEILAMGPEVYPGIRGGFYAMQNRRETPPNLSILFRDPDFSPWIIVGEKKATDLFCLSEVRPGRVITIKNVGHFVPAIVNNLAGSMAGVIDTMLSGGLCDLVGGLRGDMHDWPDLTSMMYLFATGRISGDRLNRYRRTLPEDFYGSGYASLLLAKRAHKRGNSDGALRFARMAVSANPGDMEAQLLHDRLVHQKNGSAPVPAFEDVVIPEYLVDSAYRESYDALCRLHGVSSRYAATPLTSS